MISTTTHYSKSRTSIGLEIPARQYHGNPTSEPDSMCASTSCPARLDIRPLASPAMAFSAWGRQKQRSGCAGSEGEHHRFLGPLPRDRIRVCLPMHQRRVGSFSCGCLVEKPRVFLAPFRMKTSTRTGLNGHVSQCQKSDRIIRGRQRSGAPDPGFAVTSFVSRHGLSAHHSVSFALK